MSRFKRTLIFFLSFFTIISLIPFILRFFSYLFQPLIYHTNNYIIHPLLSTIIIILFMLIQASFKYILNKKVLKKEQIFLTVPIKSFNLKQKIWIYIIFIFIYFIPLIGNQVIDLSIIPMLFNFLLSILLIEILLRLSSKTIKIYFLTDGILITGFDIRVDLPFMQVNEMYNDSGFYHYKDIEGYLMFPNHFELFLILNQGKISFNVNNEMKTQVLALLNQKNIKIQKYI